MKRALTLLLLLLMLFTLSTSFAQVTAVPQTMNFQGRLTKPDGTPIPNGNHNLLLSLYNASTGGSLWWQRSLVNIPVRNGTFSTRLDFSGGFQNGATQNSLFAADAIYLEISINGGAPLTPRQQFLSVAYAMKANVALTVPDGSITNTQIANGAITNAKIAAGAITNDKIATGTLTADRFASGIFNPLVWLLGGNSGTNGTQFLGTTNNQPLIFKVNGREVMRYQYAENTATAGQEYRSVNVLGGSEVNIISPNVVGATISGGGWDKFTGFDDYNQVTADFGSVGGGRGNTAGNYATVAGGIRNIVNGIQSTIGGGRDNYISSENATVGGGNGNFIDSGDYATVGGGAGNSAGNYATVGGGQQSTASGIQSTIGGGYFNTASGTAAVVPGGYQSTAGGDYSFAAGRRAKANHDGSFVWGDSTDANFASNAANQFNVRASGGVRLFTSSNLSSGVTLTAGDGSWNSVSDRNAKTNFQPVDVVEVLEKLASLPLTTWNYKANTDIRHMGLMAQDFHAAFGALGIDDKHISTVDADGVAFAAIQGLNKKLEASNAELKKENTAVKSEVTELKAKNAELEARLERIEAALRNQK